MLVFRRESFAETLDNAGDNEIAVRIVPHFTSNAWTGAIGGPEIAHAREIIQHRQAESRDLANLAWWKGVEKLSRAGHLAIMLLDEFDEMGRDRGRNREVLSRFITTEMLAKLARINEERKIVFLLATNYVSGFDAAFSRDGRFDMLIQVMPPNLKAKLVKWPILSDVVAKSDDEERRVICEKLENLTFTETEQPCR
jgi:hypothetical protein